MSVKIAKSTTDNEMLVLYSGESPNIKVWGIVQQDILMDLNLSSGLDVWLTDEDFENNDFFELVAKA